MIGLHGTASRVEKLVRQYRRVQEVEQLSREARQQARRSVSYHFDDEDGSLVLKARLPAESGMQLLKALEVAIADLPLPPTPDRKLGPGIPTTIRRANALALVAESFLAHGAESMSGGDRLQIVVHVDHDALRDRTAGRSEFDEGPKVPRKRQ